MQQLRLGLAALMLASASLSAFALRQTPEEVDLSWKPKVGDVTTHRMNSDATIDMGGQKMQATFSIRVKTTVKAIDGDKVTLEGSADEFKMSMNGQAMDDAGGQGPSGTTTRVVTLKGEFLSSETKGQGMPSSPRVEQMNTFYRPDGKVKVGDTWDHEIKPDAKRGIIEAKARYTLVGSEMMNKRKVWKISVLYAEMTGDKPSSLTGTIWINAENGDMEKWYAEYTDVVFAEGMPPMTAVSTLTRID